VAQMDAQLGPELVQVRLCNSPCNCLVLVLAVSETLCCVVQFLGC
jgi:hypothetical protein